MTRTKASLLHFFLSATAVLILSLVTVFYWYPSPFYQYADVITVLLLLAMVDVFLGPMLTFVVFKPNKPGLKLDLSIIIIAQVAAFIYGGYTIQAAHPEYLAYDNGTMYAVPDSAIDQSLIKDKQLTQFFHIGPRLVSLSLPDDSDVIKAYMQEAFSKGKMLYEYPEYYQPYPPSFSELAKKALDVEALRKVSGYEEKIDQFTRKNSINLEEVFLLKFFSFNKNSVIIIDKKTAQPVGYLNIHPG